MAMQADQIMRSSLNDIVFEGRNKSYGAYLLRNIYERHLMRATAISIALFLLAIFSPAIISALTPEEDAPEVVLKEVNYTELAPPPPMENTPPPQPPPDMPPPVVKQLKLTPPKVVEDEKVVEEAPTLKELKEAPVITSGPSVEGPVVVDLPPTPVVNQVIEEEDPNKLFLVVEQLPQYPGGDAALYKFITQNIRYPSGAAAAGIEGRVFVSFVCDKNGEVSNVKVEKGIGGGLDEEAVRVVKMLKGFSPAKQAGRPVNYRYILPVKFKLQ